MRAGLAGDTSVNKNLRQQDLPYRNVDMKNIY